MSNPRPYLLFVEANTDLVGLLRQLRKIKSERIVVSLPKRSLVGSQLITLKLLARQLATFGKDIVITSPDPITINLAKQADLSVDTTPTPAQQSKITTTPKIVTDDKPLPNRPAWMTFERKILAVAEDLATDDNPPVEKTTKSFWPKLTLPRWKISKPKFSLSRQHQITLAISAVGVAILGAVAALAMPQARIFLEVPSESYQRQFTLTLADEQDLQAAGHNILPGRFIEIAGEQVISFQATGENNLGEKASGQINIINYTAGIQGILANTRFQSAAGLVFRIKNEILVPPARGNTPGRAVVDAVADGGGAKYNLAAPTKLTIPGLGPTGVDLVYGEVVGNFTGGTDNIVRVVSQADIDTAKQEAAKTLFSVSESDLRKLLKRGEIIDPQFIQNDIINAIPSVAEGAQQDQFEVRVQSRSWTLALPDDSFATALANAASFEVPEGQSVTTKTLEQATVEPIEANFLTHRIDLLVSLNGRIGSRFDLSQLQRELTYQPLEAAEAKLKNQPGLTSSTIHLWPKFLTRLPLLPDNISIDIIYLGE